MKLHHRHDWNLSPSDAIALQQELRTEVVSDRPIDLDGLKVSMSMQGARVEGLAFTVGEVVLPDDSAASIITTPPKTGTLAPWQQQYTATLAVVAPPHAATTSRTERRIMRSSLAGRLRGNDTAPR